MPESGASKQSSLEHQHQIEAALCAVTSSEEFSGADRLKEFLEHVVNKDLAGQSKELRAKTIAADVYRRQPGDVDAENLVRVDAGRLRRRLDVYYAGTGRHDTVRIHVDRGGYVPRYSFTETPQSAVSESSKAEREAPDGQSPRWRDFPPVLSAVVLLALISLPLSALLFARAYQLSRVETVAAATPQATPKARRDLVLRREILFNEAPERLQALNLVEQGLGMLLPAPDPIRTQAGMILFDRARLLDPSYAGAPAGSALAMGIRAGLSPPGEQRQRAIDEAKSHAEAAMRQDATEPLSLTAMALHDFLTKDYATAKDRLSRALEIAPESGHVRDYFAIISLFAGDNETTLDITDPAQVEASRNRRGAVQNARATAMLLADRPDEAIDILVTAAASGDPISIINHAVLAASYQADGQFRKAKATRDRMLRAWPETDVARLFEQLFYDPADSATIVNRLNEIS